MYRIDYTIVWKYKNEHIIEYYDDLKSAMKDYKNLMSQVETDCIIGCGEINKFIFSQNIKKKRKGDKNNGKNLY